MDLRDLKEFLIDVSKYVLFALTVFILIVYIVSLQQVVGPSMEPNFNDGDILILNKINYRLFDIKRGQIISFKDNSSKYLIKRVIGIPGDNIEYKENKLYINDKLYQEDYLDTNTTTNDFKLKDLGYDEIPNDMYLVLGDNRTNSLDSRKLGLIKKADIVGKVMFRIFPVNKIGTF